MLDTAGILRPINRITRQQNHAQFDEARALVDRAVAAAASPPLSSSLELLELELWALVAAPPPLWGDDEEASVVDTAGEAARLIDRLMALPGAAISLDAYEHASQVRLCRKQGRVGWVCGAWIRAHGVQCGG